MFRNWKLLITSEPYDVKLPLNLLPKLDRADLSLSHNLDICPTNWTTIIETYDAEFYDTWLDAIEY